MKRCICSGILFADVACFPISHLPAEGELVTTKKIELNLGGCAGNVALNLSRLGIENYLSGCVGDDALSEFIARSVAVPNVAVELQRSLGNCPGTAMHINVQGEDRRFAQPGIPGCPVHRSGRKGSQSSPLQHAHPGQVIWIFHAAFEHKPQRAHPC